LLHKLPSPVQRGIGGLLRGLEGMAWLSGLRPFGKLSFERRLGVLAGSRTGDPIRRLMLRALVSPLKLAHFDNPALYTQLGCVYETLQKAEAKPAYMKDRVHRGDQLGGDMAIECDVVVVGTGA